MADRNLFVKAKINASVLERYAPKTAAIVGRMLVNGTRAKRVRNFIRKHAEIAVQKGVFKKKPLVPAKVKAKFKISPEKLKAIKKKVSNKDVIKNAQRGVDRAAKKANKFSFKMPPMEVVEDKYVDLVGGNFKEATLDFVYLPIIHAWHQIRHILSSAEIFSSNGSKETPVSIYYSQWNNNDYRKSIEGPGIFLKVASDAIYTDVDMLPIHDLSLRLTSPTENAELMENTRKAARQIQTFFPEYKLPSSFKVLDAREFDSADLELMGVAYAPTGNKFVTFGQSVMRSEFTLGQLKNLRPVYTHYNEAYWENGPDNVDWPSDKALRGRPTASVRKLVENMLTFQFELEPDVMGSNRHNMDRLIGSDAKNKTGEDHDFSTLSNGALELSYKVKCRVLIKWPMELAYYATMSSDESEFIPAFFQRYIALHRQYSARKSNKTGGFVPPNRIQPLHKIKKLMLEEAKSRPLIPRTNKDGFVIVGPSEPSLSGSVIWVPPPTKDRVDDYIKIYKDSYDDASNSIQFNRSEVLTNTPILVDWANSMFTYANAGEGDYLKHGVTTVDLTGSIALDDITIARDLNRNLYESGREWEAFCTHLLDFVAKHGMTDTGTDITASDEDDDDDVQKALPAPYKSGVPSVITQDGKFGAMEAELLLDDDDIVTAANIEGLTDDQRAILSNARINSLDSAFGKIEGAPFNVKWAHLGYLVDKDMEDNPLTAACCALVRATCERALKKFDDWQLAYRDKTGFMRYYLYLLTRYSKDHKKYSDILQKHVDANLGKGVDLKKPVPVVNMPNLKVAMPHSDEAVNMLNQKDNISAFVSVDAGGGKTIISMLDIMNILDTGKAKRAIVIPPTGLTSTWVDEINRQSGGMINPFPLTTAILRDMERTYSNLHSGASIDAPDYKNLGRMLLSMPPNTIFICSMEFLKSHSETIVYGDKTTTRYYMAEFLRDLFKAPTDLLCCVDESHFVKRIGTARTSAVSVLFTAAKIKRQMSGTMVFDRLTDLIGQSALVNPASLGNENSFNKRYKKPDSDVFKDNAHEMILHDLRPFVSNIRHKRRRWAFILPPLSETFHKVNLTENQNAFYDKIVKEAMNEMLAKAPDVVKQLREGDIKNERKVLKELEAHLSKVESFIYAPDAHKLRDKYKLNIDESREPFAFQMLFEKTVGVEPEDLVSPKVAKIDEIIDRHINGWTHTDNLTGEETEYAPDPNKIIVFSHRKVNSAHFYEHTRHKKICSHYQANDQDALSRFLNDDRIKVLVADETSINTGRNFQIASRIIRTETLWTPGAQEQAIARIWRPDFKDLKLEKRPVLHMDWIYTVPSFECLKIARLISKLINMKKYNEGDNPEFMKKPLGALPSEMVKRIKALGVQVYADMPLAEQLEQLRELKLSMKNLEGVRSPEQVREYFGYYAMMGSWEVAQFEKEKANPDNYLRIIAPQQRKELAGTKRVRFIPRVPGQEPFDPENKYDFKPIAIVQSKAQLDAEDEANESEDEDFVIEQVQVVKKGDVVETQWGFGIVTKVTTNSIAAAIPGFKDPVARISKACAYLIGNKKAEKRIRMKLKANQLEPRFPLGVDGKLALGRTTNKMQFEDELEDAVPKLEKKGRVVNEETDDETVTRFGGKKVNVTDKNKKIELTPVIIDKQISLMVYEADSDADFLKTGYGFKRLNDFVAVRPLNVVAFDAMMKKLQMAFKIHPKYITGLDPYRDALRKKKLDVFDPHEYPEAFRLMAQQHVKIKVGVLRPYPIIWNNSLFICFDKESQPSAAKVKAKLINIPNVKVTNEPSSLVNIYKSASAAISGLKLISEKVKVTNYGEVLEALRSAKSLNLRRG